MKESEMNRNYLAKDIYPRWKRLVSQAKENITIYTPFLDRLLLSLIGNSSLDGNNITIVTDLEPASILELPNQLQTIKRAIAKNITVLSLKDLHAKVLMVDDRFVTIGSQNFTSHGRKAKETSTAPMHSLDGSDVIETLTVWRNLAEVIDEEFVDLLLSKLKSPIQKHKQLVKESQEAFDEAASQYNESIREKFEKLERQSRIKMHLGKAYATIKQIKGRGIIDSFYYSLIADNEYDLTDWRVQKSDGDYEPYRLSWLYMYPMLILDNYRMGFARIAETRITYLRGRLVWTDRRLEISDLRLKIEINFPKFHTRKCNIEITLSHPICSSLFCTAQFLFLGDTVKLVNKKYSEPKTSLAKRDEEYFCKTLEEGLFSSSEKIYSLFEKFFKNFTYEELGIENKNIEDYLPENRYKLSVIEFQNNPFVVAKSLW